MANIKLSSQNWCDYQCHNLYPIRAWTVRLYFPCLVILNRSTLCIVVVCTYVCVMEILSTKTLSLCDIKSLTVTCDSRLPLLSRALHTLHIVYFAICHITSLWPDDRVMTSRGVATSHPVEQLCISAVRLGEMRAY